jgi:hypothetical protein
MKLTVNLVSNLPDFILSRQEVAHPLIDWKYSNEPVIADVYVIYGIVSSLKFPNPSALKIFVTCEPPEVFQYSLRILELYDVVLAGNFSYLRSAKNTLIRTGLLNWSAGVRYEDKKPIEGRTVSELSNLPFDRKQRVLSVVTSEKVMTPLHRRRLEFIEFLSRRMNEIEVFGRHSRFLPDKADALIPYSHHLALENHMNPHFWTEKVSDPILCNSRVLYVGHKSIKDSFSSSSVLWVSLDNFENAYRLIATDMESDFGSITSSSLIDARNHIIESANVHANILKIVLSLHIHKSTHSRSEFDSHPISVANRFNYYQSEFRTRLQKWKRHMDID